MSENPIVVEHIDLAAGLYFRSVRLPIAGLTIPQHTHDYDHATIVCGGRARGYRNGNVMGEKGPGGVFELNAGDVHAFMSLEPMTILTCIHDTESAESLQRKGF